MKPKRGGSEKAGKTTQETSFRNKCKSFYGVRTEVRGGGARHADRPRRLAGARRCIPGPRCHAARAPRPGRDATAIPSGEGASFTFRGMTGRGSRLGRARMHDTAPTPRPG